MRRWMVLAVLFGLVLASAHAQAPQGQLELFYQRIQGFDFNSGSPAFDIRDESFNGGGFGFVYHLTPWLGLWTHTSFYGGVRQNEITLKLINQVQGLRVSAPGAGPVTLYGKGGLGFARYVFTVPGAEGVRVGTTFNFGGGAEFELRPGMFFQLEASRMTLSLPNLTNLPDRDRWDGVALITAGIGFQF